MSSPKKYRLRYKVEPGNFEKTKSCVKVREKVTVSDDDFGFTDDLLMVSILRCPHGSIESVCVCSSMENGPMTMEEMRDWLTAAIDAGVDDANL